jgi:hypothetical protein
MASLRAGGRSSGGRSRVTSGPIETYLRGLERELRQRGLETARIVEEAREHLVDAIEDGQRRGLSVNDAEREAVERFGAPETVAAHVTRRKGPMANELAAVLDTMRRRKSWILVPTVLTAIVTSAMSYFFLPIRYRSESVIIVSRVPAEYDWPRATDHSRARFQQIRQLVVSRTQLERIIREFKLYGVRESATTSDDVLRMREDISLTFFTPDEGEGNDVGGFSVSFASSDPKLAMTITERLAALFVEENAREQVEGTDRIIDARIDDMRRRIVAYENTLDELREQEGRKPLSQADLLPFDVLLEKYKALLIKREDTRTAAKFVGEQFKIVDPARLPERPVGPSRLSVNVLGTLAGLGLGLVAVVARGRSKKASAQSQTDYDNTHHPPGESNDGTRYRNALPD